MASTASSLILRLLFVAGTLFLFAQGRAIIEPRSQLNVAIEVDAYTARHCRQFCMPRSTKSYPLHYFLGGSSFLACVDGCLCSTHCLVQQDKGTLMEPYADCYESCTATEPTLTIMEALEAELND